MFEIVAYVYISVLLYFIFRQLWASTVYTSLRHEYFCYLSTYLNYPYNKQASKFFDDFDLYHMNRDTFVYGKFWVWDKEAIKIADYKYAVHKSNFFQTMRNTGTLILE